MSNPNQVQQGDVTLEKVDQLPENCQPAKREGGSLIVARGSSGNHSHRVIAKAADIMVAPDGKRYLVNKTSDGIILGHEEHNDIVVYPGAWAIGDINEADHVAGLVRKVVD